MAVNKEKSKGKTPDAKGLTRVGPLEIDVPRSIGYFGAVALAVAFEVIEPPVGIFIAAVPFFKFLQRRAEPRPTRFIGAVLEGASIPVGGSADATIRVAPSQKSPESQSDHQESGSGGEPGEGRSSDRDCVSPSRRS